MNVAVLGVATSPFGELFALSAKDLAKRVVGDALETSGYDASDMDAIFVGNMLSGMLDGQANVGAFFADALGMAVPAVRVEGACASGGLAVNMAIQSIVSKQYERVLVLGVEKMTDKKPNEVNAALMAAGSEEERQAGVSFAGLYALIAQAYMQQYNVTEEEISSIAVKNHLHGSLNEKAQFKKQITVEQILRGTKIADPLRLLHCSPISDGAAAIVLTSSEIAKKQHKKPIFFAASEIASDTLALHNRKTFTSLAAVKRAVGNAYKKAGITQKAIDVAEIHDCFSIAEAIAVEDLGFSKPGQGAKDIAKGKYALSHHEVVINPSGGLKACGHPVGATGVKQIAEVVTQLRGEGGKRQVANAKIGLTHNVGGSGSVAVVHILKQ